MIVMVVTNDRIDKGTKRIVPFTIAPIENVAGTTEVLRGS